MEHDWFSEMAPTPLPSSCRATYPMNSTRSCLGETTYYSTHAEPVCDWSSYSNVNSVVRPVTWRLGLTPASLMLELGWWVHTTTPVPRYTRLPSLPFSPTSRCCRGVLLVLIVIIALLILLTVVIVTLVVVVVVVRYYTIHRAVHGRRKWSEPGQRSGHSTRASSLHWPPPHLVNGMPFGYYYMVRCYSARRPWLGLS